MFFPVKTVGIVNSLNTKYRVFKVFPDLSHLLYRDKIVLKLTKDNMDFVLDIESVH